MSKILITENRLRNILFKTFLKNPKLLKEQEEDNEDPVSKVLSQISSQALTDEHRKELLIMSIRAHYADSMFQMADPGSFILDHLIANNIPEKIKAEWAFAAELEGKKLRAQDLVDLTQIFTALYPADLHRGGSIPKTSLRVIDAATTTWTAFHNLKFAATLSQFNSGGKFVPARKDLMGNTEYEPIQQNELGHEATWYFVYAICDIISLATMAWFPIDGALIQKWRLKRMNEGKNKAVVFTETDPKTGLVKEKLINTAEAPDVTVIEKNQTVAVNKKGETTGDLSYFTSQSSDAIRHIVDDVTQKVVNTFSSTNKLDDVESPFMKQIDQLENVLKQKKNPNASILSLEDNIDAQAFDALPSDVKLNYEIIPKKYGELKTRISNQEYEDLIRSSEKYEGIPWEEPKLYTRQNDEKNPYTSIWVLNPEYNQKKYKLKDEISSKKQQAKQDVNTNTSKLDINEPERSINLDSDELLKKIEKIKETATDKNASTVAYDITVNKEIKERSNIFKTEKAAEGKEKIANLTQEQFDNFLSDLLLLNGIGEQQFFKELNDFLKSNNLLTQGVTLDKSNFVRIYNELMTKEGAAPLKTTLFNKLNEYSEIMQGQAKLRNITDVNEIFSDALKQKYLEKLKSIDDKINSLFKENNLAMPDGFFNLLLFTGHQSNDQIKYFISSNFSYLKLSSEIKEQLFILLKQRQNNKDELLDLCMDRYLFNTQVNSQQPMKEALDPFYSEFKPYFLFSVEVQSRADYHTQLIKSKKLNEYFYARKLHRFHKSANLNNTSKIQAILSLLDENAQNSFAFSTNNANLKAAFEKHKIGKVIDGTLQLTDKNVLGNLVQYYTYLYRYMARFESTCDIINDTDVIKEADYIFNLIDKKIIDYAGADSTSGTALVDLLGFESVEELKNAKPEQLKKMIRERAVNKDFLETINTGIFSNFFDINKIDVKIPHLVSTKIKEDMSTVARSFQLNYSVVKNLAQEMVDLDKDLGDFINVTKDVIAALEKRKADLKPAVGQFGQDIEAEQILVNLQIVFLRELNEGLIALSNNMRNNSGLGRSGLNLLNNTKLSNNVNVPGTSTDSTNYLLDFIQSREGDNTMRRVTHLGALVQFVRTYFTKFRDRGVRNFLAKGTGVTSNIDKTLSKEGDLVDTGLWGKIIEIFKDMKVKNEKGNFFQLLLHLAGLPSAFKVSELIPGINFTIGIMGTIKQIMFMKVLLGASATAILVSGFGFFVQGYLLGAGLQITMKLLAHSLPEFKQLGTGICVSVIRSLSIISKQLTRTMISYRTSYHNEIARILEDEKGNYINDVQGMANFDSDQVGGLKSFINKSFTSELVDIFSDVTGLEDKIKEQYDTADIFKDLDELYELYKILPDSLNNWQMKMNIITPINNEKWENPKVQEVYYNTYIGQIDKVFYQKILSGDSNKLVSDDPWQTLNKNPQQKADMQNNANQEKVNEFLKAIITLHLLNNLNFESIENKKFLLQQETLSTLQKMSELRNKLKSRVQLLAEFVKLAGSKDFNVDSLITGGYHSVSVNNATINFAYAKRYKYAKNTSNNKVPHFQQTTSLSNGFPIRNMALELYCYQKMKDTRVNIVNQPIGSIHTILKPIEDGIDIINMTIQIFSNINKGLPANSNLSN